MMSKPKFRFSQAQNTLQFTGAFKKEVKKSMMVQSQRNESATMPAIKEESELERYMKRVENDHQAYVRNANGKQKNDNYFSVDYDRYDEKLQHNQLRNETNSNNILQEFNESESSLEIGEHELELTTRREHFLEGVDKDKEKMKVDELADEIKKQIQTIVDHHRE